MRLVFAFSVKTHLSRKLTLFFTSLHAFKTITTAPAFYLLPQHLIFHGAHCRGISVAGGAHIVQPVKISQFLVNLSHLDIQFRPQCVAPLSLSAWSASRVSAMGIIQGFLSCRDKCRLKTNPTPMLRFDITEIIVYRNPQIFP